MRFLITGAGLIGSQIARLLVENGEKPYVYDLNPQPDAIRQIVSLDRIQIVKGDVLDLKALEEVTRGEGIDTIIHTAANVSIVGAQERPYETIKLNIFGTANILELARRLDIRNVVFASSTVLYVHRKGGLENGFLSEDNFPRTTSIYASTKLACEHLGLNYAEAYGIDFVALRFQAAFGPWTGKGTGDSSNMLRRVIEKTLKGEEATISSNIMEYVYSKDAARSTLLAAEAKNLKNRIYNVGMGDVYNPKAIIDIIKERIPSARINVEESSTGKPAITVQEPADPNRSRQEIGYESQYDMHKALNDYIDWYEGIH